MGVDLFEDEKFVYLVVENMRGGNIMKRKGLNSEKKIAEIFFKMIEVLKNLHETGIVHGDLRPSKWAFKYSEDNEDVGLHDVLRLCNFQNGDYQENKSKHDYLRIPSVTKSQHSQYDLNRDSGIDIENFQAKNFEAKKANDVFSMGVLLYGLLGGEEPFEICKDTNHMSKKTTFGNEVSKSVVELIEKMIDLDQSKRLSMKDVVEQKWLVDLKNLSDKELPERKISDWKYDEYMKEMNEIMSSRIKNHDNNNEVFELSDEDFERPSSSLSATIPIFEVN